MSLVSGRGHPLPSAAVADILNNTLKGLSNSQIGSRVGVAPSTVWKVLEAFPLWKYVREKDES